MTVNHKDSFLQSARDRIGYFAIFAMALGLSEEVASGRLSLMVRPSVEPSVAVVFKSVHGIDSFSATIALERDQASFGGLLLPLGHP